MGQVFYDMGFLSTVRVLECSATDLVGGYVGQTGPKTIQLLEKALGQVLFIDEAYRLGEGAFAAEAVNELVDSLTKPRFAGKIIVILAGYEEEMNQLLRINQGLSSRFSEEVIFTIMEPEDCWRFLARSLEDTGITIDGKDTLTSPSQILALFQQLSKLPSWGNGRDVQTIAKSIVGSTFASASELIVSHQQIVDVLKTVLAERKARSVITNTEPLETNQGRQATQDQFLQPDIRVTKQSTTTTTEAASEPPATRPDDQSLTPQKPDQRDKGVSDEVWTQFQADKRAAEKAQEVLTNAISTAEHAFHEAEQHSLAAAKELHHYQNAQTTEEQDEKRRLEQARLRCVAAQRAEEEVRDKLKRIRDEAERRRKEEAKMQAKLRDMGVCEAGFHWYRQPGGYRCRGGSHFISNGMLGI